MVFRNKLFTKSLISFGVLVLEIISGRKNHSQFYTSHSLLALVVVALPSSFQLSYIFIFNGLITTCFWRVEFVVFGNKLFTKSLIELISFNF